MAQLNHQLSSARRKVPKIYLATTKHPLDQAQIDQLLAGVLLNDEPEPIAAAGPNRRRASAAPDGDRRQIPSGQAHGGGLATGSRPCTASGRSEFPAGDLPPGEWRWLQRPADLEKLGMLK